MHRRGRLGLALALATLAGLLFFGRAAAYCLPDPFWFAETPAGEVASNTLFIVSIYGGPSYRQVTPRPTGAPWVLRSPYDHIPLSVIETYESDLGLSVLVLRPTRALEPGVTYELTASHLARSSYEKAAWTGTMRADTTPPRWTGLPEVVGSV